MSRRRFGSPPASHVENARLYADDAGEHFDNVVKSSARGTCSMALRQLVAGQDALSRAAENMDAAEGKVGGRVAQSVAKSSSKAGKARAAFERRCVVRK